MTIRTLKINAVQPVEQSVNHVFCVDTSGSMYDSLPKMRQHLKNNLSLLVKPSDTVSMIYFSSKNTYGVIFEGQKINDVNDLKALHGAVDRFLKPMCLTGFVEPIQESMNIIKRLGNNGNLNSFIFLTDGYDNQWSKDTIIKNCLELPKYFNGIAFLEYGWYCNRALLTEMAEVSGGMLIFSEDYKDYEVNIEKILQNKSVKKKPVDIGKDSDSALYIENGELIVVKSVDGVVSIPENVDELFVLGADSDVSGLTDTEKYIGLYMAITKMNSSRAWTILKSLGDVSLIKAYANCFSKQEYSKVKDMIKECVINESSRFAEGIDYNLVPKEDAYTVLDLLNDLVSGDNYLHVNHESFQYSRIGAKSVQKDLVNVEELNILKEQLANAKDINEIKELALKISEFEGWNPYFKENEKEGGEPILNLVFNESRPNVSLQITKHGVIDLPEDKVVEFNLPKSFPTHIYRNFTIIKDGILNVKILPVSLDVETFNKFVSNGVLSGEYKANEIYFISLREIPLINRKMVGEVFAKEFFTSHLELQEMKAKQKVFKFYKEEISPKKQVKITETYGESAAEWLSSIGIKDYGFAPKVTKEKSGDFYYSKELDVKFAGLSSLPAVNAVVKKMNEGKKLNLADNLMISAIKQYKDFVESPAIVNCSIKNQLIENWLNAETQDTIKKVRSLQNKLNRLLYSVVVGQTWFKEFSSLEENSMTVDFKGQSVSCQAILEEKEIEI